MHNSKKFKVLFLCAGFLLFQIIVADLNGGSLFGNGINEDGSSSTDFTNNDSREEVPINTPEGAAPPITSWWNVTYNFRTQIDVINPLEFSVTKPIDVTIDFVDDEIFTDSVRIVAYDEESGLWTPIPCQIWDETNATDKIQEGSIKFIANDLEPGKNVFFAYYDNETQPYDQTDYSENYFTQTLGGGDLEVNWDDIYGNNYTMSLQQDIGAYELFGNGNNFHQENATAPGAASLDENLKAYWTFDEDMTEDVGVWLDGDIVDEYKFKGTPTYEEGYFGNALTLQSGEYVQVNSGMNEMGGESFADGMTMMAWINPAAGLTGERIISSWDRSEYWRFAIDASNKRVVWDTQSGGISDMYGTSGSFNLDEWNHVAVTYDTATSTKKIFVNGIEDASTTAHSGNPFGEGKPERFGFFGTGSEDSTFDTSMRNGPSSYWVGKIDEYRVYDRSLDEDDIQDAMAKAGKQSPILDIVEKEAGNVFAEYDVTWNLVNYTTTESMNVTDTWTMFRGLNTWKVERTYWWDFDTENEKGAGLFNTLYSWNTTDDDPNSKDYYYYDGNLVAGHDAGFTAEDYTILHDFDGDLNNNTAIGLFLANKRVSDEDYMNFNGLTSKVAVQESEASVNFLVGETFDFDNWNRSSGAPITPEGWSQLNLTIEYWPYIRQHFAVGASVAQVEFDNLNTALGTDMALTTGSEEEVFYNLVINVVDNELSAVPDVNVSMYLGTPLYSYQMTDSNGNAGFDFINEATFTVNLTYTSLGEELWLGEYPLIVDANDAIGNAITVTYRVNLTSTVLEFIAKTSHTPCSGAEIGFKVNDGALPNWKYLANQTTDSNGNITIRYTNGTAPDKLLDFNVSSFLGLSREINNTDGAYFENNWTITMESASYHTIYVQIENFETNMTVIDYTSNYSYGESNLDLWINYTYTELTTTAQISDAKIDVKIKQGQTEIFAELDNATEAAPGIYYLNISYDPELSLNTQTAYTIEIVASKKSFNTKTDFVTFSLLDIDTQLDITTVSPSTVANVYWDQNFTLTLAYSEWDDTPIIGATATFSISEIPAINGQLTDNADGTYSLEFNSTEFGEAGTYTFFIVIDKNHMALQEDFSHKVVINNRTTTLVAESLTLAAYWQENVTVNVRYNDTLLGSGLSDSTVVTWELVGSSTVYGDMTLNPGLGEGWYSVEINTSIFAFAGYYNIRVSASRPNYISLTETITLNVQEIHTQLNGEITPTQNVEMFYSDSQLFQFDYTSRLGGESSTTFNTVPDATYRTYEWRTEDYSQSGSGSLSWNETLGRYVLDFDTETRAIGSYIITIRIQERNYISRVSILTLDIVSREFDIELAAGIDFDAKTNILKYSVNQDETVTISFTLSETLFNSSKSDASVQWVYDGKTIDFENLGNGVYEITITANKDAFYQQQLMEGQILISSDNFNNITITTQITVEMPEIYEGVPTFYFAIAVGAVSLIALTFVANKMIQNARIPGFVKLIMQTEKEIGSEKRIGKDRITVSYEQEIVEKYGSIWEILDIDLEKLLVQDGDGKMITKNDVAGGSQ